MRCRIASDRERSPGGPNKLSAHDWREPALTFLTRCVPVMFVMVQPWIAQVIGLDAGSESQRNTLTGETHVRDSTPASWAKLIKRT